MALAMKKENTTSHTISLPKPENNSVELMQLVMLAKVKLINITIGMGIIFCISVNMDNRNIMNTFQPSEGMPFGAGKFHKTNPKKKFSNNFTYFLFIFSKIIVLAKNIYAFSSESESFISIREFVI